MSPSEQDHYDKLLKQHKQLQEDYRKIRIKAGDAKTTPKVKASPAGKIDSRGVKDSGKAGMAGGLVGAWSDDINSHIELGINAAGGTLKFIYSVTMVEDVVGFCVGFLVLGLATAFLKIVKNYG
tara:strand:+ start:148 stop:519 length:372 start_codon:yes stop_codon:yes gene_type:complete